MADVKRVDYTTKDYAGYRQEMIDLIPTKLPEWTDRSDADPGIVLLELLAYQLEKNSYYNDRVANEAFLPTATKRQSVIKHLKLIDYELAWPTPARHWQVFDIAPQLKDTIIAKGTQVGTVGSEVEEPVIFETLEDLIIPAGATGMEQDVDGNYLYKVEVEHGQTITDEFIGEVVSSKADMSFKLTYTPVYRPSIEVYVQDFNGKYLWDSVTDFISSTQDDLQYVSEMNEFQEAVIKFGNGISGKIPPAPSNIYATYKAGGGIEGNVGASTIIEPYTSIPGLISTSNPLGPHVIGTDMESNDSAKKNGPASLRVLNRYVSIPDYEDGIRIDYPAVAKAKGINVDGDIDLYLAPFGGGTLTSTERDEITAIIEDKKIIFQQYTIKDPTYITVNVSVDATILTNYDPEVVRYSITNALTDYFAPDNRNFGEDISLSGLFFTIQGIEGVQKVNIITPTGDVTIDDTQIAKLGTLTVLVNGI